MNRKRWAPVAAVAAVLAVMVGVSSLSKNGGAAGPPLLRLAAAEGSLAAASADARGSYRLTGTLPDGPSEARVRDLPATAAPDSQVRALAAALGEDGSPLRVDGVWRTGDLVVNDRPGNPWTWVATCGPDTPVSSDGTVPDGVANDIDPSICAYGTATSGGTVTSGGTSAGGGTAGATGPVSPGSPATISPDSPTTISPDSPTTISPDAGSSGSSGSSGSGSGSGSGSVAACPSPPAGSEPIPCVEPVIPKPLPPEKVLLSESQALAATARIREALGLSSSPTRVEGLSVVVEPLAGGLRTNGMATVLQLSSRATLVGASGFLSTGRDGALYPLRTARSAFDSIPVIAMGAPCDATGCPEGPAITGAKLGLSHVSLADGAAALVPAWLFTVEGSPVPLVALAVADRFLAGPDPANTEPGPPPGREPGTDPGTEPGTTEPDPADPPRPPATGKPVIPADGEPFGFDGAYADPDPKVLVVRYGDSGSCPSLAVRHDVVQEPDRVVVTLTRTPMPKDVACTSDYRAVLVRVTLSAALAGREVVDGSRGEPVAISEGSPPFG